MNARRTSNWDGRVCGVRLGVALMALTLAFGASAQTPPPAHPAAPPPAAAPTPPPPGGSPAPPPPAGSPTPPPPADGSPPPPATGEPAPLAASPMLAEEPAPAPPPPPPTYNEPPPPPPEPEPPADDGGERKGPGPFAAGSTRLSILIGTGYTPTDNYLILGAGVGRYLADGLELGLDYEMWIFAEPVMHRLSPGLRYIFHMVPVIKPYVGAFYRHTFVNDYDDLNYVGGRAGIYYAPKNGKMYVGGGAVYEHLLDCTDSAFVDCDSVYPEIFFGVAF